MVEFNMDLTGKIADPHIRNVQERLNQLGIQVKADGILRPELPGQIEKAQKIMGIRGVNGIWDEKTQKRYETWAKMKKMTPVKTTEEEKKGLTYLSVMPPHIKQNSMYAVEKYAKEHGYSLDQVKAAVAAQEAGANVKSKPKKDLNKMVKLAQEYARDHPKELAKFGAAYQEMLRLEKQASHEAAEKKNRAPVKQ